MLLSQFEVLQWYCALIGLTIKILAKMIQGKGGMLVVLPFWRTQTWLPQFKRLINKGEKPVLLKAHPNLLLLPVTVDKNLLPADLKLQAALLAGISKLKNSHLVSQKLTLHLEIKKENCIWCNSQKFVGLLQKTVVWSRASTCCCNIQDGAFCDNS